jgi:hypothetical protein
MGAVGRLAPKVTIGPNKMNTWDRLNRERYEYLTKWSALSQTDRAQSMKENKDFWDELFDDTKLDDHFITPARRPGVETSLECLVLPTVRGGMRTATSLDANARHE